MKTLGLALLLSVPLWSVEVEQSLLLRNENALLSDDATVQKAELDVQMELDFSFDDASRVVAIAKLNTDAKDKIEPNEFSSIAYSNGSKPLNLGNRGLAEIRELYYEKAIGKTLLKVGKMQTVWGKADGIKLIDKLNPKDFSEFILAPFEDSRIPLWSLSLIQNFEDAELELLWIPDTTYNKMPKSNGAYAFSSSRVVPQVVEGVSVQENSVNKPNDAFKDSDLALRYTKQLENMELGVYYLYAYDDFTVLYQDFDQVSRTVTLNPTYERNHFYGVSMDYSKDAFVYRLEAGLTKDKNVLNSQGLRGIEQSDEFAYIFGVDWYGLEESLLSMQINQSRLLSSKVGFCRPKIDNTMTLLYRKDLMNNTLHAEVLAIHNLNDSDGVLRPKLSYELDEESLLYGGVDYFYGDRDGLYGQFREQNRFVLGIERTF
ncbi:MAG: Unknown protein [uncultured Sulfurovum sp.]|uniref:Uncharacterized protein n=1 Tax=uncultured Sulfurovum sp. TaxID=269237 RepID=A0A6S6UIM7_9BACT|nr:MAG: Unknown protein [uncultured Sulfurovum sp.]